MIEAGGGPLWRIVTDARITRRKYYHCVQLPTGETVFKSRLFEEAVEFLRGTGQKQAALLYCEDWNKSGHRRAILTLE